MPQIVVEQLAKSFQVAERDPGLLGALRGLVRRRHRTVHALEGLSFSVEPGELIGYIGPNGAGKSTTVKILSGILVPSSGRCEVDGLVPWRQRVQHVARIGVVFGQRTQLLWDLPVIESFELLRDIYRVPAVSYRRTLDQLVGLLELGPLLATPARQLSLGQRMRCDLAAALVHQPRLLFLDEPTIGLDAVSKLVVRRFIRELNVEQGVTVLLTTHDLDDIEALCRRVLMIAGGKLLLDGTLDDLRRRAGSKRRLIIDLQQPAPLHPEDAAHALEHDDTRLVLQFDPEQVSGPQLISAVTQRYPVRDLFVENPDIEELVAELYRTKGTSS
ncbi:MAG TPA: ATP-binding cassette domain-containing protein [Polyangiales bacterium]|nr:ATP-binding cassette domain-containing protein [Polyangiales bacterium]